jgi:hypothetical protein
MPKGGPRATALLCVLAFVAVANALIGGVRILSANGSAARQAVELGPCVLLCAWAYIRLRRQRSIQAADSAPGAGAFAPDPVLVGRSRVGEASRRSVWIRRSRVVLVLGLLVAAVLTIWSQWGTFRAGIDQLGDLHWRELRWAVYAEALALIALAALTWQLLATGGGRVRFGSMVGLTLASNALALTLPGGPVWAATFLFTQLRRRGVHASLSAYALGVTWTFSALALGAVALVGVDLAGSNGPAAPFRIAATIATVALVLLLVGCGLMLRSKRFRALAEPRVARVASHPRIAPPLERCREWARWARSVPLRKAVLARCVGAAVLNWIFDCGCLICSILAVGGHVPWQGVLAAYGLTQLAAVLPITPGGIGVVEGTLSLLLISYHVPAATAVAAVLLYRILSFWILVALGWTTVGGLVALQRRAGQVAGARRIRPEP